MFTEIASLYWKQPSLNESIIEIYHNTCIFYSFMCSLGNVYRFYLIIKILQNMTKLWVNSITLELTLSTLSFWNGLFHLWIWMSNVANRGIYQKSKQNGQQCRSWWDGSYEPSHGLHCLQRYQWAVSSGSTLCAKVSLSCLISVCTVCKGINELSHQCLHCLQRYLFWSAKL